MNFNGMTATITSGIASHSEFSNSQNVGGAARRPRSKLHKRQKAAKFLKEDVGPIHDGTQQLINVGGVQSGGISDMAGAALNLDVGMRQDFT